MREGASLGRHGTYRSHCFRCSDVGLSGGFCLASCEHDGGGKAETPLLKSVGRGYYAMRVETIGGKLKIHIKYFKY